MNHNRIAVQISKDLEDVVFIGAFAVVSHVGQYRKSRDIDLAMASPLSDEKLEELGYRVIIEQGKKKVYTKQGVKLDIYTEDVSDIPVKEVFETAVPKKIGDDQVMIMSIEALMVAKLRAARPQDNQDIQEICRRKGKEIKWEVVEKLATPVEAANLKVTAKVFSK